MAEVTDSQARDALIATLVGRDVRVLDLGVASERLVERLAQQGCTIVAVQSDRPLAATVAAFAERVIVAHPETLEFRDALDGETFDVVVAADVLSALPRPERMLAASIPLVRPDGAYIICLPNGAHAAVRLAALAGTPLSPVGSRQPHLWYDLDGARALIEAAGLAITAIERVSTPLRVLSAGEQAALPPGVVEWVGAQPEATTSEFVFRCMINASQTDPSPERHQSVHGLTEEESVVRLQARTLIELNRKVTAIAKEMGELSLERDRMKRRAQQQAARLKEAQSLIETFQRSRAVRLATALRRVQSQLRSLLRRH